MSEQKKQLAFIFPGQGSQSVAMLTEMAEAYPEIEATFAQASEVLGFDLWTLVNEGPVEELNQTHNTQPAEPHVKPAPNASNNTIWPR
jgi:[acyl-carrier-protein] S-malonyltransferase